MMPMKPSALSFPTCFGSLRAFAPARVKVEAEEQLEPLEPNRAIVAMALGPDWPI